MEEEKYLYPAENVSPIEVGENYKDYYLSDILNGNGCNIDFIKLSRREGNSIIVAAMFFKGTRIYSKMLHANESNDTLMKVVSVGAYLYKDAVLRFFYNKTEPLLVSLLTFNKDRWIKLSDFEK